MRDRAHVETSPICTFLHRRFTEKKTPACLFKGGGGGGSDLLFVASKKDFQPDCKIGVK